MKLARLAIEYVARSDDAAAVVVEPLGCKVVDDVDIARIDVRLDCDDVGSRPAAHIETEFGIRGDAGEDALARRAEGTDSKAGFNAWERPTPFRLACRLDIMAVCR